MSAATYLDEILAAHRAAAAADRRDVEGLLAEAERCGAGRGFADALVGSAGLAVIAEIKRRSPSRGDLDPRLDPAEVARVYEEGGAACLSVLSDAQFFGGSADDVAAARAACGLPVLRKDFTVAEADVADARLMGADAVLLIVAAVTDEELRRLLSLSRRVGLDALVEAHDETEVRRAVDAGAEIVGVNQRDLSSFVVDHGRALRVVGAIPDGVVAVAESGIRDGDDARRLADAGYRAVLVGETLMRAGDRREVLASLVGHRVGRSVGQPGSLRG
ncbi:MAG TPA: indole-3-glycerol phosphate synthase TrpC [Acidimicrobiales bacterium]|nr:indole-3-glycerol phosphate synthase TrpC [Acidimicrobiales bacterium]